MLQGGVGEAQHTVAEGGVGGDDLLKLAEVRGLALELGEEVEVDEVVLRNGAGLNEDRLRKEVPLKEGAAFGDGDAQLGIGFDSFGDKAGVPEARA